MTNERDSPYEACTRTRGLEPRPFLSTKSQDPGNPQLTITPARATFDAAAKANALRRRNSPGGLNDFQIVVMDASCAGSYGCVLIGFHCARPG
jgi:hypothetical protein